MKSAVQFVLLMLVCLFATGCASTDTKVVEKGRNLKDVRRFFVLRNLKDNHGIDVRIVRALQARGLEAESGPITMLPDSTQAVIVYEDRWSWDFSNHMVYLKLGARDPQAVFPYVTSAYLKQVAFTTEVDEVIAQVVGELLSAGR
ncbi:hypothetical protein [Rariglobus hedericola]|uniref:DUF302 domain-containing protein n=1 Tax=Rariglobus hedericola TaxID=2597822 RepID=A0A556QMI8_9BACT|nr:hypothetical protein [Rariglobus hedericola]TSJ77812.1 hypothetical protein FPL22_00465 [Rariglobus hedericola]